MKKLIMLLLCCAFCIAWQQALTQVPINRDLHVVPSERRDKGIFIEYKDEFLEQLKETAQEMKEKEEEEKRQLKMDFSGLDLPTSATEFQSWWYSQPISQDMTGSCWSFSATSFFESEICRLTQRKIKLSEMYTIYWEYVEKARRFVQERGDSAFNKGSQPNAVKRTWEKYGIVPAEFYTGIKPGQKIYDHTDMYEEMKNYLESVKQQDAWNEDEVLSTIKSILNHYMGEPPATITINGNEMTPKEYLKNVIKLNLDDYIDVMSLMEKPYYQKVEYEVADNWWHSQDYYNVPLDDFMKIIKNGIRNGYTICIVGDTSESGYNAHLDVAMVPTYDIPPEYIDETARQFRFSNETTTDDHAIHLVGYLQKDGKDWYLIKDSGTTARNGKNKGYLFYHEDYVKLKMMNFLVHKEVVEQALAKTIQ